MAVKAIRNSDRSSQRHRRQPSTRAEPSDAWLLEPPVGPLPSNAEVIAAIRSGVSVKAFHSLREALGLSAEELARALRIAPRTLIRRVHGGRLDRDESERLIRLHRLYRLAMQTFGGEALSVQRWLRSPQRALGGEVPLAHADTEPGAREVEDQLGRLQHGVFS